MLYKKTMELRHDRDTMTNVRVFSRRRSIKYGITFVAKHTKKKPVFLMRIGLQYFFSGILAFPFF